MNPVIFSIGPLQMTWYGLLIVAGAVLAAFISTFEAKRRGEDPEDIWNMLAWILIFGIIGARLYHVFSNPVGGLGWSWYREHPIDIIAFWNGGFRGRHLRGDLGRFSCHSLYTWRHHLSYPAMAWTSLLPGVLLAQAIGRMGNRINQELYGPPTTLPWGFKINPKYPFQPPTECSARPRKRSSTTSLPNVFIPPFSTRRYGTWWVLAW